MPNHSETARIPTWFVTGATRGIGAEVVRAALEAGHHVVAAGREVAAISAAFPDATDRLLAVALNVTDPDQITRAVDAASERFGRIDVLVNNAGYGQLGQFEEVSADAVRAQFDTNVFGLMDVTRAILPIMRKQQSGHVFNISSVGGLAGFPGAAVYCASKFAVVGFSASIAAEVAPFGVKVTNVSPGFFRTDFLDEKSVRYGDTDHSEYTGATSAMRSQYDTYSHNQPGDPAKLARALVSLAAEPEAPTHFVAGADAMHTVSEYVHHLEEEIARWKDLSAGTAHS